MWGVKKELCEWGIMGGGGGGGYIDMMGDRLCGGRRGGMADA